MLQSVFITEEQLPAAGGAPSTERTPTCAAPGLLGLDPVSSDFLRRLLRKPSWAREELSKACRWMGRLSG